MHNRFEKNKITNYFIVSATVTINGANTYSCKVGSTNSTKDYKPNWVKQHIQDSFAKKYSSNKIAVVIKDVVEVSNEEYLKESENFLNF